ncbi:MAG: hypothetical protein ABW250_10275 [Pyrinomonadaceae bacterium]
MIWRVKIPIWNQTHSSKSQAELREFTVSQPTEERAQALALIKAAIEFPPNEGWAFDIENITAKEVSADEIRDHLEEVREGNLKEGKERIAEALAELRKIGVNLREVDSETE